MADRSLRSGSTSHRGVGKPEKIADSAIELVYTSFRNNNGGFWPEVQKACGTWFGFGRKLHSSATFMATNPDMVPGPEDDPEARNESVRELTRQVQKSKGVFMSYLMAVLGNSTSFETKFDGGIADSGFVSQVYDFSFPVSGAKILQQQIGVRGQELYSLTQIQKFFKPEPYINDVVPNHVDNFLAAYMRYVPNEGADRTELTRAFLRIAEVTDALKSGALEDEAVARRNFAIASETIVKAVEKLAEAAPKAASFQDVGTQSALHTAQGFLKNVTEFRTARGPGQGVV